MSIENLKTIGPFVPQPARFCPSLWHHPPLRPAGHNGSGGGSPHAWNDSAGCWSAPGVAGLGVGVVTC